MEDNLKGKANLPDKFSANDIPKFKSTDNPKYHLKNFRATMAIKGVELELYPVVFPMSLEPDCQKWYYSLKEHQTCTWEAVARAFMEQYQPNIQLQTTLRELEVLRQGPQEGFTNYLNRWREMASQMVTRASERELVKIFIAGLLPKYNTHMKYLGL